MLHAGTFWGNRLFPIARQSLEYAQDAITRMLILAGYDPNTNPPTCACCPSRRCLRHGARTSWPRRRRASRSPTAATSRALTATQQIGRGLAAYWGLADEFAFWPWPAQQLAAMESRLRSPAHRLDRQRRGRRLPRRWKLAVAGKGEYAPAVHPRERRPAARRRVVPAQRRRGRRPGPCAAASTRSRRTTPSASPEGAYFKRFDRERNVPATSKWSSSWPTFRVRRLRLPSPGGAVVAQDRRPGSCSSSPSACPTDCTTPEFARRDPRRRTRASASRPAARHLLRPGRQGAQRADGAESSSRSSSDRPEPARPAVRRPRRLRAHDGRAWSPTRTCRLVVSDACPQPRSPHSSSGEAAPRRRPERYDFDHVALLAPAGRAALLARQPRRR